MMQHDAEIVNLAHAYSVLDVAWDASPRAIKESYRRLVKPGIRTGSLTIPRITPIQC